MTVRLVVSDDDIRGYLRCLRTAFFIGGEVTDEQVTWVRGHFELDRSWAAFDDRDGLCGTSRSFSSQLTVPGGATLLMAAVTQVTVLPTHRRQGHLTTMMGALLADARERGEPVAGLIASEWPIYGRFGYGPATEWVTLRLDTRLARFTSGHRGHIELVGRDELRALAPDAYERVRLATPGAISRDERWWDVLVGVDVRPGDTASGTEVRAVHRAADGSVDGYVVYEPKEHWEDGVSSSRLEVAELVAATDDAYRDLWRFLAEVDLITSIHAWPRPVDEHLSLHLVDGRALRWRERNDQLWLNVLDVRAALEARTYASAGTLVLDVDGTRWKLDGSPEGATCTPTSDAADLALPIASLGAAYLGGTPWRALASAGRVTEERTGALDRAAAMFSTPRAPFLTTHF